MTTATVLESVALALLLAGVLGWLALPVRPRRRHFAMIALLALVLSTGAFTAAVRHERPLSEEEIPYRPIAVEDDGYVSSRTCQSCHPQEYDTWHSSYHRRMTQVVTPESALGDFDDVTLEYHGRTYRLHQGGDLVWFETSTSGDAVSAVRRPVVLSTGSHHLQAYWYATGERRAVEFFPFIYLLPEQQWAPRESVFLQPTLPEEVAARPLGEVENWQKNRQWNHSCIHCHTTHGQPRIGRIDTRVGEFGIACEACHGAGEEHVAVNRDPRRRFRLHLGNENDDTIVNPVNLSHRRASQVCGSCHSINDARPDEVRNDLTLGRTYRPGDELTASRFLCSPRQMSLEELERDCPNVAPDQRFWSDGQLRVSGREYIGLTDSPCYQRGELSCFSCHLMHPKENDPRPRHEWANDQLKPGMDGNAACLQCHAVYLDDEKLIAHTRHQTASTGSQCQNCHMPYTSYGLLKAMRSHEIHNPSVASSLETGRPNGCNQCHLDKTLAWSAGYLEDWYEIPQPEMNDVERSVPAAVMWLLSGDAGQRALMAWSMGWEDARRASGTHWMTPLLTQLLLDPYDAVRLLASRSLRRQAGFEDFAYNYMGSRDEILSSALHAQEIARRLAPPEGQVAHARELVDDPAGVLPDDILAVLLNRRDDRVVMLTE